ncbi:MAG: hypothetical protein H6821_12090 [Planctomycetaceae bacterium]|nr:hypothetical protein [Planctomycetaceae bacterium]
MPPALNRRLLLTYLTMSMVTCTVFGQLRPEGRGRFGAGGPSGFGGGGPLELLQRADVQAELELLDDQKEELSAAIARFAERRREVLGKFAEQFRNRDAASDADREALRTEVQEAFRVLNSGVEEELRFLLPHQRKRLAQLEIQFRLRGVGGLGALGSREIGEQLAVTDMQRETLRIKAIELGREFSKKVAALRNEMQEQLLAELNADQRTKFQEMLGSPFEFQDRSLGRPREAGDDQ